MKSKLVPALFTFVCLLSTGRLGKSEQVRSTGITSAIGITAVQSQPDPALAKEALASGRMVGVVTDPSGAVVAGAITEVRSMVLEWKRSVLTDQQGRFTVEGIPPGHYRVEVTATGFRTIRIADLPVTAGGESSASVTLVVAAARTDIEVTSLEIELGDATPRRIGWGARANGSNTAEIVGTSAGVSIRENGGLASVPMLHGQGDERTKLVVDGMMVSPACANHMNPSLSYISPSHVAVVSVMAGITPVSMGGDSLGGTVLVESQAPIFATGSERLRTEGSTSGSYRSNGGDFGGSLSSWIGGRNVSMGYDGSWVNGHDYRDGSGHKVTSTYGQSADHTLTLAARGAGNLVVVQGGVHHIPYEGFVNAEMDLVRNYAESVNVLYKRSLDRGTVEARAYWQGSWHSMDVGKDKATFSMPMWMPMNTHGRDMGISLKLDFALSDQQTLRVGNESHRFVLDDSWPAVPGTAPGMGPDTFMNISDGRRLRVGWFAEIASRWSPKWTTLVGLRNDTVWMNAAEVHGYSDMYATDSKNFNALDRSRTDVNLDATGVVRYEPTSMSTIEIGYARKTRTPNIYERYAWSTNRMASGMIGWFGDGNYYVGNVSLKPEIGHNISGTATWHDRTNTDWTIKVTPYLTYVQDYVDVDTLATISRGASNFSQLRFANHEARIGGADLEGNWSVWNGSRIGQGKVSGVAGWLHGARLDTRTGLYQMMPLNARVIFDEELKGLTAGLGVHVVDRKSNVDPHRFEQKTPGYALLDLHADYKRGFLRMSVGGENVLNRNYEMPLGGVNYDDFLAGGKKGQIMPLTGRGRSFFASLAARF